MNDHCCHAPAPGAKQVAGQGFQDQADKTQQLQGVLPDFVHGAADTRQQLCHHADGLLFHRHAEVRQRAIDRLQQRPLGGRQAAIGVLGGLAQPFGAQQFHQQRSPSGVEGAEAVEVDQGVLVVLAAQGFAQALELRVVGQRPVAADP
ncbi:hypothetical protein D3C76_1270850 [compost metagenome]